LESLPSQSGIFNFSHLILDLAFKALLFFELLDVSTFADAFVTYQRQPNPFHVGLADFILNLLALTELIYAVYIYLPILHFHCLCRSPHLSHHHIQLIMLSF
jgi:hypothetical protein